MATINDARCFQNPDGKRYIEVILTPQVPDPAQEESVRVVFGARTAEVPMLKNDPYVLTFVSSNRRDIGTPYVLSDEQQEACEDAALLEAGNDDGLGWE